MRIKRTQKLNLLLQHHKADTVLLAPYLVRNGITRVQQNKYCVSQWLESIGTGAFIRPGETIDWQGALYSLQSQVDFAAHVAALTALTMQGRAHYARFEEQVFLFSPRNQVPPLWFKSQPWYKSVSYHRTNFITDDALGISEVPYKTFTLKVSAPERAILEVLYLVPKYIDWAEAYQLMEGLPTLRPTMLQKLLTACDSVRVKRLFLFMASKTGHAWNRRLDINTLDAGSGKRSLVKGGVYVPEFLITVPKELANQHAE